MGPSTLIPLSPRSAELLLPRVLALRVWSVACSEVGGW